MRLAFMGTPEFAAVSLGELIAAGHEIVAVYTKAPQHSGRGRKLRNSPVHDLALAHGLDVKNPKSFKKESTRSAFAALEIDAAIVVAYGLILPQAVLDMPRLGCFNLHGSLLPRWRGAAPIQRAIMAGDDMTGVQVMRMEAGLDTGPILLSEALSIKNSDNTASLHDRMAMVGGQLLLRFLAALERGGIDETPQSEVGVTYAEKITPEEAKIDWSRSARELDWHIRGLSPFPGAWFEATSEKGQERIKVLMSRTSNQEGMPGHVLETDEKLIIACGKGALELIRMQRAGKAAQDAEIFMRGFEMRSLS